MSDTFSIPTVLLNNNTFSYFRDNRGVAEFAEDMQESLSGDLPLTMTIQAVNSEVFCVTFVTGSSSDATEQELAEQSFCNTQVNT